VSLTLLPLEPEESPKRARSPHTFLPYIPASTIFPPGVKSAEYKTENTYLQTYNSSVERIRVFCKRCGTNLFYIADPLPEGWVPMLDVWMGSMAREDLEREWMRPERHLWWDRGIGWLWEVADGDKGMVKNPSYGVDSVVGI
jgi:hypothetical protein